MPTIRSVWMLLSLAVTVSLAGCASSGQAVRPTVCPSIPPLPQQLLKKTDYAAQVRQGFYEQ